MAGEIPITSRNATSVIVPDTRHETAKKRKITAIGVMESDTLRGIVPKPLTNPPVTTAAKPDTLHVNVQRKNVPVTCVIRAVTSRDSAQKIKLKIGTPNATFAVKSDTLVETVHLLARQSRRSVATCARWKVTSQGTVLKEILLTEWDRETQQLAIGVT